MIKKIKNQTLYEKVEEQIRKMILTGIYRCCTCLITTTYYRSKRLHLYNNSLFHNDDWYILGTRKIKVELKKTGYIVSRRKIGRIMKQNGLVSNYTVAQYKLHVDKCNESKIANELNREFNTDEPYATVVSDLTYVRVNKRWNYVCFLVDLFNREIIGYSAGPNKDAPLVYRAFARVKTRLDHITLFHTDRGNEFKNKIIDEVLDTFKIKRSLSMKGCPYDNAVAEATFKIFKTEFANNYHFESLEQLEIMLADYINWFNNIRIHSTLGYLSPREYKLHNLKKTV